MLKPPITTLKFCSILTPIKHTLSQHQFINSCNVVLVFYALPHTNDELPEPLCFQNHQPNAICKLCAHMVPYNVNEHQINMIVYVSHSYHTTQPITSFIFLEHHVLPTLDPHPHNRKKKKHSSCC